MRLGISSYTFVWGVGVPGYPPPVRPLSAEALIDRAVELGVKVLQIADNLPLDLLDEAALDLLAQKARQRRIDIEVGTCGIEPKHLEKYLALAIRLNSPLVRVVIDTDDCRPSPADVVAMLRKALPGYRRANLCLAIENHDRFPAATLAKIIDDCGDEGLGLCLDTANSLGCGEDVRTVLRELGPRVVNVHLKDFVARRLPHKKGFAIEGRPAGQGALDIPMLLSQLQAIRHDLSVILELWPPPESTIENSVDKEDAWARESIQYLRQLIAD
jgi:sugar phosphate isomerase/epimerase